MKYQEKLLAIKMRQEGLSLKDISIKLNVSKASVSTWVKNIKLNNKTKIALSRNGFSREIIEKRRESRLKNEKEKRDIISKEAEKEFENINLRELKIIGLMLYYAEGSKTNRGLVRISNSNPSLIKIMMRFFREIYHVPENKFRGHIHTHEGFNILETEKYWSKITNIPTAQFFKTYTKQNKSSKNLKHNLPYGTFDIYVCNTKLFLKIMATINKITKLILEQ